MTDAKLKGLRHLTGPVLAFGAFLAAASTNEGCGGSESTTATATDTGTGSSSGTGGAGGSGTGGTGGTGGMNCNQSGMFQGSIAPGANGGFTDAFDATPDGPGNTVYFTAVDAMGNPGVFKQGICGPGSATPVFTGGSFEAPFGISISTDDKTLFVSDISAEEDGADPTGAKDKGVLFSLSAAGGTEPNILVGSVSPRGVVVVQEAGVDQVYFTGIDKATKEAGVFKVAASGGGVTVVAKGAPFNDPSGVAVAANGDVYVADTSGSQSQVGNIILVTKGTATEFVSDLQVGYPAGVALTMDDSMILVSGLNAGANSDIIFEVVIASKEVTPNTSGGIGAFGESAGLHRAHGANVFAWADTKATPAGLTGTGTVFVIK